MKLPFSTLLDKDLAQTHLTHIVYVLNKDKSVHATISYGSSFTIDEIYYDLKSQYPKKLLELEIIIE